MGLKGLMIVEGGMRVSFAGMEKLEMWPGIGEVYGVG